jgi:hypothetical protein
LVPTIVTLPQLHSIAKLPLVKRVSVVNLSGFAMWQVVVPLAFVKELGSGELAVTIGFVISYLPSVKAAISANEEGLLAVSYSIIKAAFVYGAVIVNNSSEAMRQSIFPLSLVVSAE